MNDTKPNKKDKIRDIILCIAKSIVIGYSLAFVLCIAISIVSKNFILNTKLEETKRVRGVNLLGILEETETAPTYLFKNL